jgi:hypothetical protein
MMDTIQLWLPMLADCNWQVILCGAVLGVSAALFFAARTVEYLVFFGSALIFAMSFMH